MQGRREGAARRRRDPAPSDRNAAPAFDRIGRSKIEEQMAQWPLMAHDRLDADTLQLATDILGFMLGGAPASRVRCRPRRPGLITSGRSSIMIVDRRTLERELERYRPGR